MAVRAGQLDAAVLGPLRSVSVSYVAPVETSIGSTAVPTSEPGTGQVNVTLSSGYFTALPAQFAANDWSAFVVFSARNTGGGARTVSWKTLINGATHTTGSTSVNNNNWIAMTCPFYPIALNDVIQVKVWASNTGVNYDYYATWVRPTRVFLESATPQWLHVGSPFIEVETISLSPPTTAFLLPSSGGSRIPYESLEVSVGGSRKFTYPHPTYGHIRLVRGDAIPATVVTNTNPSNRGSWLTSKAINFAQYGRVSFR